MAYVKLFSSILDSTVWEADPATRVVWITLMAMADRDGEVSASVPGLARRAGVSRAECERALAVFIAPDPDSRTKEFDGRRIEPIDGGWRLLNYEKYRDMATAEEAKAKAAARQKRYRERQKAKRARDGGNVTNDVDDESLRVSREVTDSEAEAEAESKSRESQYRARAGSEFDVWRKAFQSAYQARYGCPSPEGKGWGQAIGELVRWGQSAGLKARDIEAVCDGFLASEDTKTVAATHHPAYLVPRAADLLGRRKGKRANPYETAKAELAAAEKAGDAQEVARLKAKVQAIKERALNAAG